MTEVSLPSASARSVPSAAPPRRRSTAAAPDHQAADDDHGDADNDSEAENPEGSTEDDEGPDGNDEEGEGGGGGAASQSSRAASAAKRAGEKKKKKKRRRRRRSSKKQLLNSKGEKVTAREFTLEKTLIATQKAFDDYQTRVNALKRKNAELKEICTQQEKDAMEVITAYRDETDKRLWELNQFKKEIDATREIFRRQRQDLTEEHERKIADLLDTLRDKEAVIHGMQDEISLMKEFRKKRNGMLKDVEDLKAELADAKRVQRAQVVKMEKKFYEEKVRLQKEANRQISELAAQAHREALSKIDDHARSVFKENVRIVEALSLHEEDEKQLQELLGELTKANWRLERETSAHSRVITQKIVAIHEQQGVMRALREKMCSMEHAIGHVVWEFERERHLIGKVARKEIGALRSKTQQLQSALESKTQELRHIYYLAQNVVDLRTDIENMFLAALEAVREEVVTARNTARTAAQEEYNKKMEQVLQMHPGSQEGVRPEARRKSFAALLQPPDFLRQLQQQGARSEKPKVSEMTWEQKEQVLALLFTKINAASSASENAPNGAARGDGHEQKEIKDNDAGES